jgi:ABC-type multidrug transport system fused ATPase/permease subunit
MDHGHIVERGTQDQLMQADGLYRRMWELQMRILDDRMAA